MDGRSILKRQMRGPLHPWLQWPKLCDCCPKAMLFERVVSSAYILPSTSICMLRFYSIRYVRCFSWQSNLIDMLPFAGRMGLQVTSQARALWSAISQRSILLPATFVFLWQVCNVCMPGHPDVVNALAGRFGREAILIREIGAMQCLKSWQSKAAWRGSLCALATA